MALWDTITEWLRKPTDEKAPPIQGWQRMGIGLTPEQKAYMAEQERLAFAARQKETQDQLAALRNLPAAAGKYVQGWQPVQQQFQERPQWQQWLEQAVSPAAIITNPAAQKLMADYTRGLQNVVTSALGRPIAQTGEEWGAQREQKLPWKNPFTGEQATISPWEASAYADLLLTGGAPIKMAGKVGIVGDIAKMISKGAPRETILNLLTKTVSRYGKKFKPTEAEEIVKLAETEIAKLAQKVTPEVTKGIETTVPPIKPPTPIVPPAKPPMPPTPLPAGGGKGLDDMLSMIKQGRKPPPKPTERGIKIQEYINDMFYGLRQMQTRVGKVRPIRPGGSDDFITAVTRMPGAANVGFTRAVLTKETMKKIAPDIPEDIFNVIINSNHYKEVLAEKGVGRVMAGGFTTQAELDNVLRTLQQTIGVDEYNKATQASEVIKAVYASERERLVNAGLLSREVADEFAVKYPWYNPLKYADDLENFIPGQKVKPFSVISNGIKRLTEEGTAKAARAPMDILYEQMIQNETRIQKNEISRAIINLAKDDPKLLDKVTKKSLIRPVAEVEGEVIFRPYRGDIPGTLSYFENGKRQVYEVPEFIYREATQLMDDLSKFNQHALVSFAGSLTGISRAAFTTFSPAFVVSNVLNDSLTAFVKGGILPYQTVSKLINIARGLKNDKLMQAFNLSGARQARFFGEDITKKVLKHGGNVIKADENIPTRLARLIPTAGEAGEQAPRIATFEKYLNKHLPNWRSLTAEEIAASPEGRTAAASAVEVTINFGRGGFLAKSANPFLIFMNANMEGMKLPFRAIRDSVPARWRLAGMTAASTAIGAYNMSYPEYFDIPNDIRWGSILIMLPSKEIDPVTNKPKPNYMCLIPRTREWGAFTGSFTYAMEKLYADSPIEFGTFASTVAPQLFPFADIPMPVVIEELVEQTANWDFYRSMPIVSDTMERLPAEQQVEPWVSPTIQAISGLIPESMPGIGKLASPIRMQHAFNGLFGGAGQAAASIGDYIVDMLNRIEPDSRITGLVRAYNAAPTAAKRAKILKDLSPEDRDAVFAEIRKPKKGVPIVTPIVRRIMPERGGQLLRTNKSFYYDERTEREKDLTEYNSISGDDATNRRLVYRTLNPEIDATLFMLGKTSTFQTESAKNIVKTKIQQYDLPEDILSHPIEKQYPDTPQGRLDSARDSVENEIWSQYPSQMKIISDEIIRLENTNNRNDAVKARQMLMQYPQILMARRLIAQRMALIKRQQAEQLRRTPAR